MVRYTGFVLISNQAPLLSPTYVKYCNANSTAFAWKKNAANSQAIRKGWYLLAERERGKKKKKKKMKRLVSANKYKLSIREEQKIFLYMMD